MAKKSTKVTVKKFSEGKKTEAGPPAPAGAMQPLGHLRDDFHRLSERFDRMFADFPTWSPFSSRWLDFEPFRKIGSVFGAEPRIDVAESDKGFEINVELPGIDEKDLDVTASDGMLTVKGEKRSERDEKKKNYHLSERTFGSFQRSFRIPESVERDKIAAKFDKGVLTLTLPKSASAKSNKRQIAVNAK